MTKEEKAIRDFCGHHADWWPSTTQIKEMLALAQKDQDCVGWFGYDTGLRLWFEADKGDDDAIPLYKTPKSCPTCEALARTVMLDQISHDTAPPQRTWVGLTDDEIKEIVGPHGDIKGYTRWLFDQIEAKLKEKNND
jgi:hypothetical protein